jgi:antirestriction protein ArdC
MTEMKDCNTRITGKIIADLKQGVRPWFKRWNAEHAAGRITRPLRHNGIPYRIGRWDSDGKCWSKRGNGLGG